MNHLIKKPIKLLPFVFLSALFLIACGQQKMDSKEKTVSYNATAASNKDKQKLKEAPNFKLEMMNGEMFKLSEHEGQVIVLNIWATWCPPCRKEIPYFVKLQEKLRDEGVLFVGVSMDREGWKVVRPFAKKYNINYPIVVDDGTVYRKYGPFRGIPTTFIINKKGKIEYVALGMIRKNTLKSVLTKLASR